ncbi:hypothetical protein D3C86_1062250 [compost metagenome]
MNFVSPYFLGVFSVSFKNRTLSISICPRVIENLFIKASAISCQSELTSKLIFFTPIYFVSSNQKCLYK